MRLFLMGIITCLLILAVILFVIVNLGYEIVINGTQRKKDRLNKAADVVEVVRCGACKWFDDIGCAIRIVDDSDRPSENDFCSFAEREDNG